MTEKEFIQAVVSQAQLLGYKIEYYRNHNNGLLQIDFTANKWYHKKLNENHLKAIYPRILADGIDIGELIESVAPGRPCVHSPMKKIIGIIKHTGLPTNGL